MRPQQTRSIYSIDFNPNCADLHPPSGSPQLVWWPSVLRVRRQIWLWFWLLSWILFFVIQFWPRLTKYGHLRLPFPSPSPIIPIEGNAKTPELDHHFNEYHGGIMMVAIKIELTLCNRTPNTELRFLFNIEPLRPIPGCTDGTHTWHKFVYNFLPQFSSVTTISMDEKPSFAALSHWGVQWTSTNGTLARTACPVINAVALTWLPPICDNLSQICFAQPTPFHCCTNWLNC